MYSKTILVGNVGKDPEIRTLESGAKVATFPLATNKKYKTKEGEKKEQVQWHNIVVWRGLADIAEKYVKKGDRLHLEGANNYRSYEDKDGNTRYITEIVCDGMLMLSFKGSDDKGTPSGAEEAEANVPTSSGEGSDDSDAIDDLPFVILAIFSIGGMLF